jgi:hypothetical protein
MAGVQPEDPNRRQQCRARRPDSVGRPPRSAAGRRIARRVLVRGKRHGLRRYIHKRPEPSLVAPNPAAQREDVHDLSPGLSISRFPRLIFPADGLRRFTAAISNTGAIGVRGPSGPWRRWHRQIPPATDSTRNHFQFRVLTVAPGKSQEASRVARRASILSSCSDLRMVIPTGWA